jgi:hypothetical protein
MRDSSASASSFENNDRAAGRQEARDVVEAPRPVTQIAVQKARPLTSDDILATYTRLRKTPRALNNRLIIRRPTPAGVLLYCCPCAR